MGPFLWSQWDPRGHQFRIASLQLYSRMCFQQMSQRTRPLFSSPAPLPCLSRTDPLSNRLTLRQVGNNQLPTSLIFSPPTSNSELRPLNKRRVSFSETKSLYPIIRYCKFSLLREGRLDRPYLPDRRLVS